MLILQFGSWYASEQLLARIVGWPSTLIYSIIRDALIPLLWVQAWISKDFVWHGQTMRAEREVVLPNSLSSG